VAKVYCPQNSLEPHPEYCIKHPLFPNACASASDVAKSSQSPELPVSTAVHSHVEQPEESTAPVDSVPSGHASQSLQTSMHSQTRQPSESTSVLVVVPEAQTAQVAHTTGSVGSVGSVSPPVLLPESPESSELSAIPFQSVAIHPSISNPPQSLPVCPVKQRQVGTPLTV